jgi:hypothetical protein
LLIAESVGADQERAAGLVFWSTLLALMTAPCMGRAAAISVLKTAKGEVDAGALHFAPLGTLCIHRL